MNYICLKSSENCDRLWIGTITSMGESPKPDFWKIKLYKKSWKTLTLVSQRKSIKNVIDRFLNLKKQQKQIEIQFILKNCHPCIDVDQGKKFKWRDWLTFPVSTTYLIFGMVKDVSATLVATIQRRHPSGGGSNTCTIMFSEERDLIFEWVHLFTLIIVKIIIHFFPKYFHIMEHLLILW